MCVDRNNRHKNHVNAQADCGVDGYTDCGCVNDDKIKYALSFGLVALSQVELCNVVYYDYFNGYISSNCTGENC